MTPKPNPWHDLQEQQRAIGDLEAMIQYGKGSYPEIVPKHTHQCEESLHQENKQSQPNPWRELWISLLDDVGILSAV